MLYHWLFGIFGHFDDCGGHGLFLLGDPHDRGFRLGEFAPGQRGGLVRLPVQRRVRLVVIVRVQDHLFVHFQRVLPIETEAESIDHLGGRMRDVLGLLLIIDGLVGCRFLTLA